MLPMWAFEKRRDALVDHVHRRVEVHSMPVIIVVGLAVFAGGVHGLFMRGS